MHSHEPVSIVILTKDEAANIAECLQATLDQMAEGDETIVVDSASSDATLSICERFALDHPGRVRIHAFPVNVSFGEARNVGVSMAKHDVIVFVSADAVPEAGWLDALRGAMRNADIAYGRQRHAPPVTNAVTVSRGLRYHKFESDAEALPEAYASNVNAAYRRFAFETLRFDDDLPGSEDVAFAKMARLAGLRIAYARRAVVRHKDVTSWRGEWRKHLREGAAQAALRQLLGAPRMHIAWAALIVGLALLAAVAQSAWALAAFAVVFFAPTLRRLASPAARRYKPAQLVGGAAISPIFDLAFVASYLSNRMSRRV